jgi:hypothetical protein
VRIELCIDVDPSDFTVLLMIARQDGIPLDALIKKIIADYVTRRLAPPQPQPQTQATERFKSEEEKR